MNRRKGFTLIELLIVIAIIALLMAILMPTLTRVKKQANAVACQTNLKQWCLYFSMYADDNDGYFHEGFILTGIGTKGYWTDKLRPYYKDSNDVRLCPAASKPIHPAGAPGAAEGSTFLAWGVSNGSWYTKGDYGSYGTNTWICNPPTPTVIGGPSSNCWRSANTRNAGQVPMFLDCTYIDSWVNDTDEPPPIEASGGSSNSISRFFMNRHDGGINALFLDCSVRKVGLKELFKLKWHRTFDTSVNDDLDWSEYEWLRRFPSFD